MDLLGNDRSSLPTKLSAMKSDFTLLHVLSRHYASTAVYVACKSVLDFLMSPCLGNEKALLVMSICNGQTNNDRFVECSRDLTLTRQLLNEI